MDDDDLHSIAFSSSCSNLPAAGLDDTSRSINNSSSQGWGWSNWGNRNNHIGVFNADNMSQYMDSSAAGFVDADNISTGYLQDVLFNFSSYKRRRLLMLPDHHQATQDCWTSNLIKNCCQDFDSTLTQFTKSCSAEEANSETYDSSSSSQKELISSAENLQSTPDYSKGNLFCLDPIFSSAGKEKRQKRMVGKVVYPFALVKPGGFEGDMTLNDINERILMPPTRAVRHPVGDFACRPLVSPDGLGLSGKAVVAITRIHTQGRGTITIIRTRG